MIISDLIFELNFGFLLGLLASNFDLIRVGIVSFGTAIIFFCMYSRHILRMIAVIGIAFIFGIFYFNIFSHTREIKIRNSDASLTLGGFISEEPIVSPKAQTFFFESAEVPFKIKIITSRAPAFHYGDKISVHGFLSQSEHKLPLLFFPDIKRIGSNSGFSIKKPLIDFKHFIIGVYQKNLSVDTSALLAGIIFGDQSGFTQEFKRQMAASGTTHLVALSGYNIAILVGALAFALNSFLSKRFTFIATTFIIVLFVLMVGAQASVVRAALMGFFALAAREVGRFYDFRNSVALTAGCMSFFDPFAMRNDIGFVLSFVSLLGIVYIAPVFRKDFDSAEAGILGWRMVLTETASAQIAVLPILVLAFNSFSMTALAANLLILIVMPLIMFCGFTFGLIGSISASLGLIVALFTNFLLAYAIGVIRIFSAFQIPIGHIGSSFLIFYYAVLLGFLIIRAQKYS